jgi:catechol 2,3-dioxygenase-like lactoylglutathione lyase family enzyme
MKLNQVTISVSDMQRSKKFYIDLGLDLIVEADHYCRFKVPGNETTFSIHLSDTVEPGSTVIYFECEELDKTVSHLNSKGFEFTQAPADQTWLWREAYLEDPDGHRICLYYAGEYRLNPPWRKKY